jgi:hypothetical protein
MHHVSWPLLMMKNIELGMPDEWVQGDIIKVRLYTFGIIPLGEHTVHIRTVHRDQGIIQSHEYGDLIQALDHTIQIEPFGRNLTLYTDDVLINAGIFTPFLAWGVRFFYRYRQSRWQHFARQWNTSDVFDYS